MGFEALDRYVQKKSALCIHANNYLHMARDAGAGGQWGQLVPTTWKLWGLRPPTLNCQCFSFLFLFVFASKLWSLPKNS